MKINKTTPLVSIVMPVYNAEKFLVEAIESVLHQTYKNYELFLVDDKSQDGSWKIIQSYKKKYPSLIKAVHLKENTNAAGNGAVNAVYTRLKGHYIARMDADDIALPERIEKQVAFMQDHPHAIVCGTQCQIINEKGEVTGIKTFPTKNETIYNEYFVFHPILHPSVMIRKSLVPTKNYLYENKFGINDDYFTFFKLLQYGHFFNLNEFLVKYRMHGNNSSLQNPKAKFINSLKIRFQAVTKFHYKPTIKGVAMTCAQIVTIFLIPEKFIIPLYFFVRGMKKHEEINMNTDINLAKSGII